MKNEKNYKIISILLVSVMLLCSCSTVVETQMQPTPTEEATPTSTVKATPTPMPTRIEDIGRIIYPYYLPEAFNNVIEPVDDPVSINQMLKSCCVVEENVPKDIMWEYNGIEFELEYWRSMPFILGDTLSDIYCDIYGIKHYGIISSPSVTRYVAFKHGTGQVMAFALSEFPRKDWPESNLNTLEDYLALIKETAGESVDLANYELTCTTEFTDKHGEKRIINEYYEVAEDEEFIQHNFCYTLKNGENETGNRIHFKYESEKSQMYSFKNEISDYSYDEVINVTDEEMEESRKLIDEYTKNNKKQYIKVLSDFEFVRFDALYGREYLVFNFMYYTDVYADYLVEDNQYIYIDYERLQWKMALEGKT